MKRMQGFLANYFNLNIGARKPVTVFNYREETHTIAQTESWTKTGPSVDIQARDLVERAFLA
jgi:hypothetical protein